MTSQNIVYLDTHIVLWIYGGQLDLFNIKTQKRIEDAAEIRISPFVLLELRYLKEIHRIKKSEKIIFQTLEKSIDLSVCTIPIEDIISIALDQSWTRDPFDRIIAAQAIAGKGILLTKDKNILKHVSCALI